MKRNPLLILFLLLLATLHARAAKPNVLFLFADDMLADSVGALGNPIVKTPNLDSVARRGFILHNAYCLGGNSGAVCTPSRNMLLSGNGYFRWRDFQPPKGPKGMLSPGDGRNFPVVMKAAGYETYHYGKKGNTALLIQEKFDHNNYLSNDMADRKHGEPGREIADGAVEFIAKRDASRPFFMYLAFANPHDPRVAAKKYMDLYEPEKLPLPKNYLPVHPFDNGEMTIRDEALLPWPRTPEAIRQVYQEYYATITGLDYHIGRILEALKKTGQMENTIIIFSADQGIAIGAHGLLGKQNLYDAGMKVPLFFAGPGISKGGSDALVYLLDIFPTVCDLTGAEKPAGIDGVSFKPVLDGMEKTARKELFFAYRNVQRAIRDERWKLIRYPEVNVTQLFDLQNDPDEMRDLAGDPKNAERVSKMMTELAELEKKWGDDLPLTVANPKPAAWTPPAPGMKAGKRAAKKAKQ